MTKPPGSLRPFIVSNSVPDGPEPGNIARPQPAANTTAISGELIGLRPSARVLVLDDYARALYRRWKQGKRIRQLARTHGTLVEEMEEIIRRMAA